MSFPFDGIDVVTSPHVPRGEVYVAAGRRSYMHPGTLERMIEREGYMREAREIARRVVKEWEDRLFPPPVTIEWSGIGLARFLRAQDPVPGPPYGAGAASIAEAIEYAKALLDRAETPWVDWQVVAMRRVLTGEPWRLPRGRRGF